MNDDIAPDLRDERCHKLRYPDKRAAVSARNQRMKSRRRPKFLRCYPCPTCHGWHITHRPQHHHA